MIPLRLRLMIQVRNLSVTKKLLKGHSKWDNIKNIKKANDQSKSKVMSALQLRIKNAVKSGGADTKMNKALAELQLEYRRMSFSEESFQRAVKNAQELLKKKTAQLNLLGPSGSMFIVEAETPAKKLKEYMGEYLLKERMYFQLTARDFSKEFVDKGVVVISSVIGDRSVSFDEVEELGIILDCDDVNRIVESGEDCYELVCVSTKLNSLKKELVERGYTVKHAEMQTRASSTVEVSEEDSNRIQDFYQFLQRNEMITQVYDNVKPDAAAAEGECLENVI